MDPIQIILILAALYLMAASMGFIVLWATSRWWLKPFGRLVDYSLQLVKLILDRFFHLLDLAADNILAIWKFYLRFLDGLSHLFVELIRELREIADFYLDRGVKLSQGFHRIASRTRSPRTLNHEQNKKELETPNGFEDTSRKEGETRLERIKRIAVRVVNWLLFFLGDGLFAWGISRIAFHQVIEGIALVILGMALMVPVVLPLALSSVRGRRKGKWRIAAPLFWFLAAVCLWIGITNVNWSLFAAIGIAAFSLLAMASMVIVQLHPE